MLETWPQLYVDDADEQPALRALGPGGRGAGRAPWTCEQCGEVLGAAIHQCWRCGMARCGTVSDKH
jgi:hypothetical protein